MEEIEQMKAEDFKNRLELMEYLTEIQASEMLHFVVEQTLQNTEDKEATAKKIINILQKHKEKSAIKKIQMLMFREALISLIHSINVQVPIKEENRVLLLLKLNTQEKIFEFNDWLKSKISGDNLKTTEAEIMRVAVKIDKSFSNFKK